MVEFSNGGSSGTRGSNVNHGGERNICIMCYCGLQAEIRTSRTTDNPSKLFYGCPQWENGGCNLFIWYERVNPSRRAATASRSMHSSAARIPNMSGHTILADSENSEIDQWRLMMNNKVQH